ncbi:MAG: hypothetical protein A2X82_04930 [Geobacteraceae bacterium GWC2_55_20]|nr:MAG: hypothetical protein A2X82_04930 [Geobacteraceae bacterium GWC2_55_20]OGU24131.1 MAG: hypothetical protein A2X85_12555 [Geobacteraceae bacterium GWF2_54_21]HBA71521.1 hypothetical protein [Geobacter sp.]HCE66508.1 hypothetical protein [Geobacter sp.]
MSDQNLWRDGLVSLNALLSDLSPTAKKTLPELLSGYCVGKESLAGITLAADSETICRDCSGQCCLNGKYRVNVFDGLALCAAGISVVPDFSQKPLCPYSNARGCILEPGFRPLDCILFVCDSLEGQLPDSDRVDLTALENNLRECLRAASLLLNINLGTPLLLWAEKPTKQPIHNQRGI